MGSLIERKKRELAGYEANKVTLVEYEEAVDILFKIALGGTSSSLAAALVLLAAGNPHVFYPRLDELRILDMEGTNSAFIVMRAIVDGLRQGDGFRPEPQDLSKEAWKKYDRVYEDYKHYAKEG